MSVGRIITSVDHDCCPKNARLKMKITQPTDRISGTRITHGISAALTPSAIFRDAFTLLPRRTSQLGSGPPTRQPTPEAAYGIHPIAPAVLMSSLNVSNKNFGSQKR